MATWNIIQLSEIRPDRNDAEYFRNDYRTITKKLIDSGKTITLGKLFKKVDRGDKAEYKTEGVIPVLRSVNVRELGFNDTRQEYVSDDYYSRRPRGRVIKDDIIITSTGTGTLGRTSIWYKNNKAFNVPENSFLRDPINVDPYLIAAFLNTEFGIQQLFQHQRGSSGQLHLYPVDIRRMIVPECLFPFQTEIGDKLREAFKLQEDSQTLYQQATALLEQELGLDKISFDKPKSYTAKFSEVVETIRLDSNHYQPKFEQLLSHLKANFECKKIGYLVSCNRRGLQPKYVENGEIDVINSKHITSTHLKYGNFEKTTVDDFKSSIVAQVQEGDVLIYTTGAYVGLTNVYLSNKPALASNHVNILRLKDSEIDSTYIALVLNTTIGKLQTEKHIRGSAQAELYPNDISKFIVPLLSKEKMTEIGNLVRSSLKASQQSKQLLQEAKNRVEQLIEAAANQ